MIEKEPTLLLPSSIINHQLSMESMAHIPKPKQEEESGESAPLWIISFADMISLLMAFFVMLSTFSSFGPAEAEKLQRAMTAMLSPNFYGGWNPFAPTPAVGPQAVAAGQQEKGSDKPTLEETQGSGLLAETKAEEFRTRKVFLIESRKVFGRWVNRRDGRFFTLWRLSPLRCRRIVIAERAATTPSLFNGACGARRIRVPWRPRTVAASGRGTLPTRTPARNDRKSRFSMRAYTSEKA
jgi:hypothetical protein